MKNKNRLKQIVEDTVFDLINPTFDIVSKDNQAILHQIQHILNKDMEAGRKVNEIGKLIELYKGTIKGVNSRIDEKVAVDGVDRFRPVLEIDLNSSGIWRTVIEPMPKDSPGSVFYFDDDLRLMPSHSKIDTVYPFLRDTFEELNNSGSTMFQFVRQVFIDTGLVIPPVPKC